MVYIIALTLEVFLKLKCIRSFTVHILAFIETITIISIVSISIQVILVTLVVAIKAITVGHRITNGNIVKIFIKVFVAVSSSC